MTESEFFDRLKKEKDGEKLSKVFDVYILTMKPYINFSPVSNYISFDEIKVNNLNHLYDAIGNFINSNPGCEFRCYTQEDCDESELYMEAYKTETDDDVYNRVKDNLIELVSDFLNQKKEYEEQIIHAKNIINSVNELKRFINDSGILLSKKRE